jgi:carboxypeptidase family protein
VYGSAHEVTKRGFIVNALGGVNDDLVRAEVQTWCGLDCSLTVDSVFVLPMTETGTDQTRTNTSEPQEGRYSFPNLEVGTHTLTVSGEGFRKYFQTGIILQVASNIGINVQLQIGALTQTVEVQADAEMIETKDNSIAQVFDSQQAS